MKGVIDKEKYKFILRSLPIVCVDLIIVNSGKFILGKRTKEPAKGRWFPPGGRILKDEKLIDAVVRKAKEELNLKIDPKSVKFLGVGETMFKENYGRHSINLVYKVPIAKSAFMELKKEHHVEMRWFGSVDKKWDAYVKHALRLAGFK